MSEDKLSDFREKWIQQVFGPTHSAFSKIGIIGAGSPGRIYANLGTNHSTEPIRMPAGGMGSEEGLDGFVNENELAHPLGGLIKNVFKISNHGSWWDKEVDKKDWKIESLEDSLRYVKMTKKLMHEQLNFFFDWDKQKCRRMVKRLKMIPSQNYKSK